MFGDIFSMLSNQQPDAWFDTASQLALNVARGQDGDPNPAPTARLRLEELAPLVARRVEVLVGETLSDHVEVGGRVALTTAALAQWRPLLEPALALARAPREMPEDQAMLSQLGATLGPLFLGFQVGSVAGHFSERAWSLATLPLPRTATTPLLVARNLDAFAEAWSLETDETYIYALAHEFTSVCLLTKSGVSDALRALLVDTVHEAASVQADLLTRLQELMQEGNFEAIGQNPEALLDEIAIPEHSPATDALNVATSVILAYTYFVAQRATEAMLGPRPALAEASRRHRVTDARGEKSAAAIFGIDLYGPHHQQASDFVEAIFADHGIEGFVALTRADGLVTPREIDDPAAWWHRVSTSPLA